jgi:hypothetical protein
MIERPAGDVHELTARIAYERWERGGRPLWSAEVDWFAAEKDVAALGSRTAEMFSLFAVSMKPNEE